MKINFIVPSPANSGGMQVIYEYAIQLEKRGHTVQLIYPLFPYDLTASPNNLKTKLKSFMRFIWFFSKFVILRGEKRFCNSVHWNHIYKICDQLLPDSDVIIATAWPTAYDVANLSSNKGKKFYFIQDIETWNDRLLGEESYKLPLKKMAIAKWIVEEIHRITEVKDEDIPIIYNGIDFEMYNLARKYNTLSNARFLMLDHNLEKKGVRYGVEAFERIRVRYPNVTLTMFGIHRSENVPEFATYIQNPSREKIIGLYNTSDIFIYPSLNEGWGLTVIEAMASGCAVIGTNTGCLLELGQNGKNCLMSVPGDVESMEKNIMEVLANVTLFKTLIYNGKKTAQNLNWESSVERFERIITCK